MRLILLGPQGSGKSTQGKMLAAQLNVPYIAAGDISREIRLEDSEEGRIVRELIDNGKLIPSDMLFKRLEKKLSEPQFANGFILDGCPRSPEQLDYLDKMLTNLGIQIDRVLLINLSDEEGTKRLIKQAQEQNRADASEAAIKQRYQIYHTLTEPILEHFRKQNKLVEVDGRGSIEEVHQLIESALGIH